MTTNTTTILAKREGDIVESSAKKQRKTKPVSGPDTVPVEKDGERLRCLYLLPQKNNRQCNMTRRKGDEYCAQHKPTDSSQEDRIRIPCPINPRHSIRKSQLNRHVKKCQKSLEIPKDIWHSLDMNIVDPSAAQSEKEDCDFDRSDYQQLAMQLESVWEKLWKNDKLPLEMLNHDGLKERTSELESPKHAAQQASLIGHMEKAGLLDFADASNNTGPVIITEFGCGRAELSRYVAKAQLSTTKEHASVQHRPFLLIDRAGPRMKFDTKILKDYEENAKALEVLSSPESSEYQKHNPPPFVKRAMIDIKDLNLNVALNSLFPDDSKSEIVAISKHLCGCATDLTLQCLANALNDSESSHRLKGLVIALCCRQICTYETYPATGRKFLIENGLISTPRSFRLLIKMTSWAINGRRDNMSTGTESAVNHPSGLTVEQREKIGYLARRAIDHGRMLSLRKQGFEVKLIRYVDSQISLENVALIAHWP